MEFSQIISSRRSIRAYENKPVSDEILKELLEAGTWAPSAVNLQPWYFVAIKSKEQMEKLTEIMGIVSQRIEPNLKERFAKHPAVVEETTRFVRQMGGAPVCILAFQYKPNYDKTDGKTVYLFRAGNGSGSWSGAGTKDLFSGIYHSGPHGRHLCLS